MKTKPVIVIIIVLAFFISACSKPGPGSPLEALNEIKRLFRDGKNDDVRLLFSSETISIMNEIISMVPDIPDKNFGLQRLFVRGAEWNLQDEKINGDSAMIRIKYTEHPAENMKGYEMTFRMKKESGKWKWDIEKELRESLRLLKGDNRRDMIK